MTPDAPILGIWGWSSDEPEGAHHDAGAAVVVGGEIVAAVNEERITRRKNEGRWPAASIEEVLSLANVSPKDVAQVAMAGRPPIRRALAMLREVTRALFRHGVFLPNRTLYALLTAKKIRRRGPPGVPAAITFVPHHDAHAASAYWTAPFLEATVLTLDGIGDSAECGAVYRGTAGKLTPIRRFSGYDSPGILYAYFTRRFGFRPARHEGKVMGLAARGDPKKLAAEFRKLLSYDFYTGGPRSPFVARLFRSRTEADWSQAALGRFAATLDDLIDRNTREDVAAALQAVLEHVVAKIAARAVRDTGIERLALAGGVFANVRINQVLRDTVAREIWVHPNMGDGGLAAGAALAVWAEAERRAGRTPRPKAMRDVYLGTDISEGEAEAALRSAGVPFERPSDLAERVTQALLSRRIVGYARGRMEYGPRALCHRTILAPADDPAVTDELNRRLRRNDFMPFAPVVSEEVAPRLLEGFRPDDAPARYMTITYRVTEEGLSRAPAVVHVDGTARPQVLSRETEPTIHEVLARVLRRARAPALINTSFNMHEEPIVRTAEDAVRAALRGAVDDLVVGPFFAEGIGGEGGR